MLTDSNGKTGIVCDNGTGFVKCGYAGTNYPDHVFPSVVGRPILRSTTKVDNVELEDVMFGSEATAVHSYLELSYPMESGKIMNWDDMKLLYEYTFGPKVMNINPSDHKIMLTEPPQNPLSNRDKIGELLFEQFGFHGLRVEIQALLALYAKGYTTGVVVDSGDGVTHICPVYQEYVLDKLIRRLDVAGRMVTTNLMKLVLPNGYVFNKTADYEVVRRLKEMACYVAYDVDEEVALARETTTILKKYKLPDGRIISLNNERFSAPECLFQPSILDIEQPGVAEMIFNTIQASDVDTRKDLYRHILITGGSMRFPGMRSRIEREIKQLYLQNVLNGDDTRLGKFELNVIDSSNIKYMVFVGGAFLAKFLLDKDDQWILKSEYEEKGVKAMRKFCSEA